MPVFAFTAGPGPASVGAENSGNSAAEGWGLGLTGVKGSVKGSIRLARKVLLGFRGGVEPAFRCGLGLVSGLRRGLGLGFRGQGGV